MEHFDDILEVDIIKEVDALTMWDILDDLSMDGDYYSELTREMGID
ncbi:MAG: hypothetical protein ACK5LE_03580 [Alphaproteobacteria bacterium]